MSVEHLVNKIDELVADFLDEDCKTVTAKEVGLDERCGTISVSEEAIVIQASSFRIMEYYGGFEYVDRKHVLKLGDTVIYLAEYDGETCERVQEIIDRVYNKEADPSCDRV